MRHTRDPAPASHPHEAGPVDVDAGREAGAALADAEALRVGHRAHGQVDDEPAIWAREGEGKRNEGEIRTVGVADRNIVLYSRDPAHGQVDDESAI